MSHRLAAAGGICASIAHGLLVPLDTVKTRLQTGVLQCVAVGGSVLQSGAQCVAMRGSVL